MSERIELSEELRARLLSPDCLPGRVTVNGKDYIPEAPIAAGFKAAVWKVNDEFGRPRALKLCIYDDYQNRSYLQEAMRAAELEDYRQFAKFVDAGLADIQLGASPPQTFVCFVEGWINGYTLEHFIGEMKGQHKVTRLLSFVQDMSQALQALKSLGLQHDDLHHRNIMFALPNQGDLDQDRETRLIDPFDIP